MKQLILSITGVLASLAHAAPPAERIAQVETLATQGKYAEAMAEVDALLKVDPDDAQLKELRQVLAQMAKPAAAAKPAAPTMSAADRLELKTLAAIMADLAAASADPRRAGDVAKLAEEILMRSQPLATRLADEPTLWLYRAAAALPLDRIDEGSAAAQRLKALGAMESADANIAAVMVQLNRKGWLDEQKIHVLRLQKQWAAEHDKNWAAIVGSYTLEDRFPRKGAANPWTGRVSIVRKDGRMLIEGRGEYRSVTQIAHIAIEKVKHFSIPLQEMLIPPDNIEDGVEVTGAFKSYNDEVLTKANLANRFVREPYLHEAGGAVMHLEELSVSFVKVAR